MSCSYGCGIRNLIARNQARHEEAECPNRQVDCQVAVMVDQECTNHGCTESFPARIQKQHELYECEYRLIPCPQECGDQVLSSSGIVSNAAARLLIVRIVS